MSVKVAELTSIIDRDDESAWVGHLWQTYNFQRQGRINQWEELRNYLFATDTTTTTNSSLPWRNTTTLPKLCQIRDNLHANYLSALFPNDNWLQWQGYTVDDSLKEKAKLIESYMSNKTRLGGFRNTTSKLVYDYIDYGCAFSTVDFVSKYKEMPDGTKVPDFIGPKARRISPLDIVFNPLADSFEETFKIVRSVKSLGEIKKLAESEPENEFWQKALDNRADIVRMMGAYSIEGWNKAVGYEVDGFGNMFDYYSSEFMEILEFYGDYHNSKTGELFTNRIITVADRATTVRNVVMPQWYSDSPISMVGWRERPDNLWPMGPLDNLVGLQYRLDHLENIKADAMDLIIFPPLMVKGEVEEFVWGPGVNINVDENGDVREISTSMNNIFGAAQEMQRIEDRMELYAGAPREAMGIRSPGEKTAFEVDTLATAAGKIFQEKITHFEIELQEKSLNKMLESTQRNLDVSDTIRVFDDDIGADVFRELTASDITANGKIRPVGARHFSKQAKDLRTLSEVFTTPLGEIIKPHTDAMEVTKFINDTLSLEGYKIFKVDALVDEKENTILKEEIAKENINTQLAPGEAL